METVNWFKTEEYEQSSVHYHGKVLGSLEDGKSGDFVLTQKGDIFKFVTGVNGDGYPYMSFAGKIKAPKFPNDSNVTIEDKTWQPLGTACIYKIDDEKYYWEY